MSDLETAAWRMLHALEAIDGTRASEPEVDEEGNPTDPAAWLLWYDTEYLPKSRERKQAHALLAALVGHGLSQHPLILGPFCKQVIGNPLTEDEQRWLDANPQPARAETK